MNHLDTAVEKIEQTEDAVGKKLSRDRRRGNGTTDLIDCFAKEMQSVLINKMAARATKFTMPLE